MTLKHTPQTLSIQRRHERLAEHMGTQHGIGLTQAGEIVVVEGGAT